MCVCCDCNCHGTTAWETPLKAKEPRKSQRNKTRSWKQACRFANIMQTDWSAELARTGQEPKTDKTYRPISMFVSLVLTNIKGFSYIPVIVSHIWDKFLILRNTVRPALTCMTTCDLDNSMIFCLFWKLLRVLLLHIDFFFLRWLRKISRITSIPCTGRVTMWTCCAEHKTQALHESLLDSMKAQ